MSRTSLDGWLSGIPDLDSLKEYNIENGTRYTEGDFRTCTDVWNKSPDVQALVKDISPYMFRVHVLKFKPGGFFPIHRDYHRGRFDHIRLICPIDNCAYPANVFILNGNILHDWEYGRLYFLNTVKDHMLFNASTEDSYWLIFNVDLNEDVAKFVHYNLFAS